VHRVNDSALNALMGDTQTLKDNAYFLHGFFGDQNIFARRRTKYVPSRCRRILIKAA
jgi:hypothetical protein